MQVRLFPNAALKTRAEPVTTEDIRGEWFRPLISEMFKTMYRDGGVGLAAPQVGISKRLLVLNDGGRLMHGSRAMVLINPEIIYIEGTQIDEEGCLSLPGIFLPIERTNKIGVRYIDTTGNICNIEADGFLSRIIQHEVDHLDGILFFERASKEVLDYYSKNLDGLKKRVDQMRFRD